MLRCTVCEEPISEARIKAFMEMSGGKEMPDRCEVHAVAARMYGLMSYGHKTAGEVVMMKDPSKEQIRQMQRAFRRAR